MAGVTMLFLLALASGLAAGRLLRGSSDQIGPIVLIDYGVAARSSISARPARDEIRCQLAAESFGRSQNVFPRTAAWLSS